MNRFSKDIDVIDNLLGGVYFRVIRSNFCEAVTCSNGCTAHVHGHISSILGAIILVHMALPWFLIGCPFALPQAPKFTPFFLRRSGWMIRRSAEVENDVNSAERVVCHVQEIEQEKLHEIPEKTPAVAGPADGCVYMRDVVLSYRPEPPPVLKGISTIVASGRRSVSLDGASRLTRR